MQKETNQTSCQLLNTKALGVMKGNCEMGKSNINIFGDVHAINIGSSTSIQGNLETEEKKRIFKKLLKIISVIISFLKAFIYRILLHR